MSILIKGMEMPTCCCVCPCFNDEYCYCQAADKDWCANCSLFSWWDNENDKGASCGLFGDSWDSRFQYEDKDGSIVGCYIDRHYIEQTEEKYEEHLEEQVKSYLEWEAKHER